MERKPFEVETTKSDEDQKPYSAVDGGGSDSVDSFDEDQKKLVYRGWKVMPFIIGNAYFLLYSDTPFLFYCVSASLNTVQKLNKDVENKLEHVVREI